MKGKTAGLALCVLALTLSSRAEERQEQSKTAKASAATAATENVGPLQSPAFFPVAVWYSGGKARAPMLSAITPDSEQEWREDLQKIKRLGFNTVRTWVEWTANEPREGEYHFENLDLLLKLAQEAGLKVIVQVYLDSAPEWVGKKFPDGQFMSQGGQIVKPQAAPGYCFDHPGVRRAMLKYLQEAARHAIASPAFYAWDLWSEPAVMNWASPNYLANPQFCYCPYTQARFREWLKEKYGTLEALNRAWYRTFQSWDEVEPPRFGTILTYTDFMDWRIFIGDKLAQDLHMRSVAVKEIDHGHATTSHAPNPSPVFRTLADSMDASDDFLMKDAVDFFGTSFYPKLTSPDRDFSLERRALIMDMTRAVTGDKGFYVGELQAGFGVHGVIAGNPITPQDLELYTWGMVARGAKAINYYAFYPMSTGYEAGGYGLIHLDGTLSERGRQAGAVAQKIAANSDLILQAKPQAAEAAVIFNPLTPLLGGEQAYGDRRSMHRSTAGYHRMFFERNLPLDFLSARELAVEKLRRYKLIIVPYPVLMTRAMADALEQYVKSGGHLFVEARAGWVDEQGHAQPILPGFGWHTMCGVRESEILPGKQFRIRWGDQEFMATGFQERFAVLDPTAKPLAHFADGVPAAYEHGYGKGSVIVLGAFAGEFNQTNSVPMHPLGGILAKWAGLASPQLNASSFVELRIMSASSGSLVFLFNHDDKPAKVAYHAVLERPARKITELSRGTSVAPAGKNFDLTGDIPAETVRIYRVDF